MKNKNLDRYTEEEVVDIITKVAKRYATKYKFGYYDACDIEQEAFIIGWKALSKYNGEHPLENFLAIHIRRRLLTLRRDKYNRPNLPENNNEPTKQAKYNKSKKNLIDAVSISNVRSEGESGMSYSCNFIEDVEKYEILYLIDINLDINLRQDYLRLKDGISLPKHRKDKVYEAINNIMKEYGYDPIKAW
jgi:hypothetical protein